VILSLFIGYFGALFLGALLGSVGGGGAILSVPIFVYAFGVPTTQATQYSLWVVALGALVGLIPYVRSGWVRVRLAWMLGVPSFFGVLIGRRMLVPRLPDQMVLPVFGGVSRDEFLMGLFTALMFFAARSMLKPRASVVEDIKNEKTRSWGVLSLQGVLLGLVTGILGAGGGFLIVPLLVGAFRLPMKEAVGTSLMMIAMNSALGFGVGLSQAGTIDWRFLLQFTGIVLLGVWFGVKGAGRVAGDTLKRGFGLLVFVLAIGIWIQLAIK